MGEKLGQFLRKIKREQFLVLGLLGLLLLVLALPVKEKEEEAAQETAGEIAEPKISDEREQLQSQLEEALSQVEGVGEVRVLITMDTMGERIVEKDAPDTSEKTSQEENTVYERREDGRETPYITSEILPRIRGVLVIAKGGGNPETVQQIQEAVEALFHLEAHKIKVMKMK